MFSSHFLCVGLNATEAPKDCSSKAKLDTFCCNGPQKPQKNLYIRSVIERLYVFIYEIMFRQLHHFLFFFSPHFFKKPEFSSLPPVDVGGYSSTFISAAYEPDMIYAVPLTSLAPSSLTSSSSSSLPPLFSLPCSLSPLCRALYLMGIRVARQTTSATARRGKLMRRSS